MSARDDLRSRLSGGRGSEVDDSRRERSEQIAEKYRRRAAERAAGRTPSAPVDTDRPESARMQRTEQPAAPARQQHTERPVTPARPQRTERPTGPARQRRADQPAAPAKPQRAERPVRTAASARSHAGGGGRPTPNRSLILGIAALVVLVLAVVTVTRAIRNDKPSTAAGKSDQVAGAEAAAGEGAESAAANGSDAAPGESVTETETPMETTTEAAAVYNGEKFADTGIPAVALTYDDGPKASTTPIILDVLEEYNAHATFFIVGQNVEGNEDLIKREEALGCELGNHSWDHAQLKKLSESAWKEQLSKTTAAIEAAADHTKVTVMRPPYGAITQEMRDQIDIPVILWRLDTLDWKTKSASATIDAVLNDVKGGDVILMHDIHDFSAEATKTIVPKLIEKGYKLLTVTELYDYYGEELTLHHNHGYAEAHTTAASEEGSSSASEGATDSSSTAAPESAGDAASGSSAAAAENPAAESSPSAADANQ